MTYHDGAGQLAVEVISIAISLVTRQRFDLFIHVFLGHFDQKVREESIGRPDDVEAQDGDAAKGAQGFIGHGEMILVDILFGMDKDQIGIEILAQPEEVFQDLLPGVGKDSGRKWTEDDFFFRHTQDGQGLIMLRFHIFQIGVFLVVRKCDTQDFCLFDDVMEKCTTAQFDIIRVGAKEKDSLAEEIHSCLSIQHCIGTHGERSKCFDLDGRGMKAKPTVG